MKKVISVVLSLVMLIAVTGVSMSAFAVVESQESTTKAIEINVEVNGNETNEVVYEKDPTDPTKITFTYTGDGELQGWEFLGMVEGQDYIIVSEDGNSITIQLINGFEGPVTANAIVKDESGGKKSNEDTKSPKTGATAVTAVAVAGAGIAVLAALKKKNED